MDLDTTSFSNVINNCLTSTPETRHGINPANRQPNPEVPISTGRDLEEAVKAARAAFKTWSTTDFDKRREAINAYAKSVEANKSILAQLLTKEQGKPLSQAMQEVELAVHWARTLVTLALPETTLEDTDNRQILQRYTPLGVVGAIVPWNYPVVLAMGKIIGAVYTGNAVILKPSPYTPYCGLKLAELAMDHFPPGVMQALSGDDTLGPMMTEHGGIDKISFTGSTATGRLVMASCSKTLKRLTLELGGNDAAIICDDIDLEAVIPKVATLAFLCSGQTCMTVKRLYIHEKIYDEFRARLVKFVGKFPMGEGTRPDVFIGPVQNWMQFNKAKVLMRTIEADNLTAVLGGTVPESPGYFIPPTIVDNPPEASRIVQEEPFAPILPILKWSDEADVIARANASDMGLGASVWSQDLERARRIVDRLEAGNVWINTHFEVEPFAPFGGHKSSGIGTEWGLLGLTQFCNSQTVYVKKSP
ncbi:Aldehyde/histidinol dehydrogenase [Aspergillus pseudoustus]|uniref:aldehyde dehydrogenase (NAD(+)) n=1 Tax=Aspergillus pseudoustus TaxID=1810923 RepID=A0ABR4IJG8_9EURO